MVACKACESHEQCDKYSPHDWIICTIVCSLVTYSHPNTLYLGLISCDHHLLWLEASVTVNDLRNSRLILVLEQRGVGYPISHYDMVRLQLSGLLPWIPACIAWTTVAGLWIGSVGFLEGMYVIRWLWLQSYLFVLGRLVLPWSIIEH